jgi:hypothetical protein
VSGDRLRSRDYQESPGGSHGSPGSSRSAHAEASFSSAGLRPARRLIASIPRGRRSWPGGFAERTTSQEVRIRVGDAPVMPRLALLATPTAFGQRVSRRHGLDRGAILPLLGRSYSEPGAAIQRLSNSSTLASQS